MQIVTRPLGHSTHNPFWTSNRGNVQAGEARAGRLCRAMLRPPQIAPSILGADLGRLADEVADVVAGGADLIHVDVMDVHFVPNLTFGPEIVRRLRTVTALSIDVHMMVRDPERYVEAFALAGADIITVHAEATVHLQRTLTAIRQLGKKAGVALNPNTPESVLQYVLADTDLILVMTVNPGFAGQQFLPEILPKISKTHQLVLDSGFDINIEVDGGVTPETARRIASAGADILVAGAAIYGKSDRRAAIADIRAAALGY